MEIGDHTKEEYFKHKTLPFAVAAIRAYQGVIDSSVAQIRYKEATGSPTTIDFLED